MRINQFLAAAGLGSRRSCEQLIIESRVSINGKPLTQLGAQVDPSRDIVRVDGKPVKAAGHQYYILNKPAGFVCTRNDELNRRTVYNLLPEEYSHLFTVGRLDRDSEGLLIMTNDGEFANRLTHPRYKIPKIYEVLLESDPDHAEVMKFLKGVYIKVEEDEPMKRATAEKVFRVARCHYEITLTQGYKRQIRQMFLAIGHPVRRLRRIQIGNLRLGNLRSGLFRSLKPSEVKSLLEYKPTRKTIIKKPKATNPILSAMKTLPRH
ncbi:pseudouridine synthase [Kamptonema cortianum]|nr:pseudouridine synthase [Oscillatoria laete-virens]MDK3160238.1 pseudouridine synthase [Kamptonema cortianum]MDL5048408.1 pseudouridine synthase [Oscillatoria amoena NRMC-F 0135]MDL5055681.1 pseudouridine synthase [Oscillatoria laete-virens NRMC-F 0139]